MVFNSSGFFIIFFLLETAWLIALTVVLLRTMKHYNALIKGTTGRGLKDILEQLLTKQHDVVGRVTQVENKIQTIIAEEVQYIQRVGIVRFNPFADTGGSQSFVLALLDGHDNGIVMTSLYARAGSRWYIKSVRAGKGLDVDLSKEESQAVEQAKPVGIV